MIKSYFVVVLALFTLALTAQQVDQVQRSLISKKTATWCQYCGSWGWTLWDEIYADNNNDKALPVQLHYSNSSYLYNQVAKDIYNQFTPTSGTPSFYINNASGMVLSGSGGIYPTLTRQAIKRMVDSMYLISPVANTGFNATVSGTEVTVNSKTKFFKAASGEYFVNTYIVLDKVTENQKVENQGYVSKVHDELLQASATAANSFGVSVASGSITANAEYTKTFTYSLDPTWSANDVTILTILWKKNGSDYEFVNGTRKRLATTTDVADVALTSSSIKVYPTVSTDKVFIKTDETINGNAIVTVYDILGKQVSQSNITLTDKFELSKANDFGGHAGIYIINIQAGNLRKTSRVEIQ